MTIFKVAYNPGFSEKIINALKEHYFPSMVDDEGISGQYSFDCLEEIINSGDIEISKEDMELFEKLKKENIDYIEV